MKKVRNCEDEEEEEEEETYKVGITGSCVV